MTPRAAPTTALHWALSAVSAGLVVLAVGPALGMSTHGDTGISAAALILTFALAPLFLRGVSGDVGALFRSVGAATVLVATFSAGHALFSAVAPTVHGAPAMDGMRLAIVASAFAALYATQATIAAQPTGRLARVFYPACFAGFYLDELCTRLTFRMWPPRGLPVPSSALASRAASSVPHLKELHA